MEHQLHVQRQKLRPDHHERRKAQTMAEAVKCMAAITALYFELLTVGVGLLMMTGGG